MTSAAPSARALFDALCRRIDAGQWWPADTRFEIVVGAVLTQNVAWRNVEYSLANLREAGLLEAQKLATTASADLQRLIRPSGFMRAKSETLIRAARWFLDDASHTRLSTDELRASLIALKGIGPETADDIVLYGYERPVFIWDLYARRFLSAAGWAVPRSYEAARRTLQPLIDEGDFMTPELAHFHGLIVEAGKKARSCGGWESFYPTLEVSQGG